MSTAEDVVTLSASASRLIGRVKWFNNKAGYGFITVTDGEHSGSDIFVHHSAIAVDSNQYKYLVQGEYIEFSEVNACSGPHKTQVANVVGVKGGKLMCETRLDFKIARSNYKTTKNVSYNSDSLEETLQVISPPQQRIVFKDTRVRGEGPQNRANKEWTLVSKTPKSSVSKYNKSSDLTSTSECN